MTQSELISSLLERYWPDECDAVGTTNVQDIVEGSAHYEAAEGGSYIDLELVITVLVGATEFIKNTISIYKYLREKYKKPPTPEELKTEIKSNQAEDPKMEPSVNEPGIQDQIFQSVCDELNDTDSTE